MGHNKLFLTKLEHDTAVYLSSNYRKSKNYLCAWQKHLTIKRF